MPAPPVTIYWEDLEPGSTMELGSVTPTAQEIMHFARQFDPQPFHLDEAAGKASIFGGLCASGWHTCSLAMRLMDFKPLIALLAIVNPLAIVPFFIHYTQGEGFSARAAPVRTIWTRRSARSW
jgi:hypothetical protein